MWIKIEVLKKQKKLLFTQILQNHNNNKLYKLKKIKLDNVSIIKNIVNCKFLEKNYRQNY